MKVMRKYKSRAWYLMNTSNPEALEFMSLALKLWMGFILLIPNPQFEEIFIYAFLPPVHPYVVGFILITIPLIHLWSILSMRYTIRRGMLLLAVVWWMTFAMGFAQTFGLNIRVGSGILLAAGCTWAYWRVSPSVQGRV